MNAFIIMQVDMHTYLLFFELTKDAQPNFLA